MYIPSSWGNHARGGKQPSVVIKTVPHDKFVPTDPNLDQSAGASSSAGLTPDTQRNGKGKRAKAQGGSGSRPVKRRRAGGAGQSVEEQPVPESLPPPPAPDEEDSMCNTVFSSIRDAISKGVSGKGVGKMQATDLELDTVLSRIPYNKMLEELFGGEQSLPEDIPVITRAYEEQFMRECSHPTERPCVMGDACECMFIDTSLPFVGVEFIVPGEEASLHAQMCVVCSRKVTQQLYYDMVCRGISFRAPIQRYGNICEQPGEYARECMLICPPNHAVQCMPLPIVEHQRNRYSVRVFNGTKYLRQHRVYQSDFQ